MFGKENLISSPKKLSYAPRVNVPGEVGYKQRANVLFDKLNNFKTNLEIQKHSKFSQLLEELRQIQNNLQETSKQKEQHLQKVLMSLSEIDKEISNQKNQFQRFQKLLDNIIESTNRECQNIFDKMTKERENNQNALEKYIDFKIQSFVLKNKGVWLEQDLLNFEPFKEQLNYLRKQIQQFYKGQQRETQKLKKQVADNLDKQKQFILNEMKRKDYEDIMAGIESIYGQLSKRVANMVEKRQNTQQNVLSMIQNVVNSYIRDSNKFK